MSAPACGPNSFNGVRARLYGLEAEAAWQLSKGTLDTRLDARLDSLRGRNQDSGEPLPVWRRCGPRWAWTSAQTGGRRVRRFSMRDARPTCPPASSTRQATPW